MNNDVNSSVIKALTWELASLLLSKHLKDVKDVKDNNNPAVGDFRGKYKDDEYNQVSIGIV